MDKILVFIPAYQCEKQIARVLNQFSDPAIAQRFDCIVVVDNQSNDATLAVAVATAKVLHLGKIAIVRNQDNYGLGGSHKAAIVYAMKNGYSHVVVLHGDDQGDIRDLIPVLDNGWHGRYDACLGARFMSKARLMGYSRFRVMGNLVFNLLFTLAAGRRLYDLGSGLNIYSVATLSSRYWMRFPDNLMFNYRMILAHALRSDSILLFTISWREDDQVSNVKLFSQAGRTLAILWRYVIAKRHFLHREFRSIPRIDYLFDVVEENL